MNRNWDSIQVASLVSGVGGFFIALLIGGNGASALFTGAVTALPVGYVVFLKQDKQGLAHELKKANEENVLLQEKSPSHLSKAIKRIDDSMIVLSQQKKEKEDALTQILIEAQAGQQMLDQIEGFIEELDIVEKQYKAEFG